MKQVKAHIAVSLDGHTATLDNELDWLSRLPADGSKHLYLYL